MQLPRRSPRRMNTASAVPIDTQPTANRGIEESE